MPETNDDIKHVAALIHNLNRLQQYILGACFYEHHRISIEYDIDNRAWNLYHDDRTPYNVNNEPFVVIYDTDHSAAGNDDSPNVYPYDYIDPD